MDEPTRRRTDGWFGWLTNLWDFIDKRDIDKHIVSLVIIAGTWRITEWAMHFAQAHPEKSGTEVAAIIASVMVPYSALQAAALKFYFEVRSV